MNRGQGKESGYEGLVFAARHWQLLEWLEKNWGDDSEKVTQAAHMAKIDKDTIDQIVALRDGEYSNQLKDILDKTQNEHAKLIVDKAIEQLKIKLKKIPDLRIPSLRTSGNRRKPNNSARCWWDEFHVLPRYKRIKKLYAGVEIDFLASENGSADVYLIAYLSLDSGSLGAQSIRGNKSLADVIQTHTLLDKKRIEASWPNYLIMGASQIHKHADSEFRLDANALIKECLSPLDRLTSKRINKIYAAA